MKSSSKEVIEKIFPLILMLAGLIIVILAVIKTEGDIFSHSDASHVLIIGTLMIIWGSVEYSLIKIIYLLKNLEKRND